jgi:hypothetical protein
VRSGIALGYWRRLIKSRVSTQSKSAATVKGLTPFANALDLSIDDLIFGPYFGVPRHRGTLAHSAVNSTAALSTRAIKGGACRLRLR